MTDTPEKDPFDIIHKWNSFLERKSIGNLSYNDFMVEQIVGFFKAIGKDKDKALEFIDMMPDFLLNFDTFLLPTDEIHNEHYNNIRSFLEEATKVNKKATLEACKAYGNRVKSKYPIQSVTNNLLIIQDNLSKLVGLTNEIPLKHYSKQLWNTLRELVEKNQRQKFLDYFFDWCLKYAYIIEAYLKEYLLLVLKIECIFANEDFNEKYTGNETIGTILTILEGSEHDMQLVAIRNAVFHANYSMQYRVDFEKRKIIFRKLKGDPVAISIKEFVGNYFGLIQIVQTELLAVNYFLISLNRSKLEKSISTWTNQIKKIFESMKTLTDEEIEIIRTQLKKQYKDQFRVYFDL